MIRLFGNDQIEGYILKHPNLINSNSILKLSQNIHIQKLFYIFFDLFRIWKSEKIDFLLTFNDRVPPYCRQNNFCLNVLLPIIIILTLHFSDKLFYHYLIAYILKLDKEKFCVKKILESNCKQHIWAKKIKWREH